MYNGIGLQSARGSGTSGYVQKNLSTSVKKFQSKEDFLKQLQQKRKNNLPPARKANEAIVQHEKKRQILIQTLKLRQKLSAEGLGADEISEKVKRAEQLLKQKLEEGKIQTKAKDTHVLTEAKEKEYMKLSKAFGVMQKRSVGSAFDFQAQRQEKLKRQYQKSIKSSHECPKPDCGKTYSEEELLQRHLKYKHPEIYQEIRALDRQRKDGTD